MEYITIFDVLDKPISWRFPLVGSLFVIVFSCYIIVYGLFFHKKSSLMRNISVYLFTIPGLLFSLLWTGIAFNSTVIAHTSCQDTRINNQYLVIEGSVQDFRPGSNSQGSLPEQFSVEGVIFAYSDYMQTCGFNTMQVNGGPIQEGLQVRISYIPSRYNTILRIERAE